MKTDQLCILITGASSGIGYTTAEYFQSKGWIVYGLSRSGKVPADVRPLLADIAKPDEVRQSIDRLWGETARLDAVVNAAGIGGASSVEDFPTEEVEKIYRTNVLGTFNLIKATMPLLRRQKQATFIAISSIAGLMGVPFHGVYSSSKFAVEGLIETLRLELANTGVRAISVCPGDTATPIIGNQYRAHPSQVAAHYRLNYEKAERAMRESVDKGIPSLQVAKVIHKAITHRNPVGRYVVGSPIQRAAPLAKRLLPNALFETIMKAYYGLKAAD